MLKIRMRAYVSEQGLIPPGSHVLAACSGGADSVCLLLLLKELAEELDIRVTAVHVNHGLRGTEADEDEAFVQDLAEKAGIPCVVKRVDAGTFREQERLSLEEAARILRYRALEEVRAALDADLIAAAHHLEDQAETVLLQMLRGSGLRGLSGMRPKNGCLIRPMLPFTREEILEELRDRGQSWREDQTNASDMYARNLLRNQVFPLLRQIRGDAARKIAETADTVREADRYLAGKAEEWIRQYGDGKTPGELRLPAGRFLEQPLFLRQEIIYLALRGMGFRMKDRTRKNIEDIAALSEKATGKRYPLLGEGEAVREYGELVIRRTEASRKEPVYTMRARVFPYRKDMEIPAGEWKDLKDFQGKECTKWFDYGKINQMPVLRTRQEGDRFSTYPGSRKKLKDYLIDEKVPREKRDSLMLAAAGSEVLWIIGMRMNESYKVTENTEEILEITITGAEDEREDQYYDL